MHLELLVNRYSHAFSQCLRMADQNQMQHWFLKMCGPTSTPGESLGLPLSSWHDELFLKPLTDFFSSSTLLSMELSLLTMSDRPCEQNLLWLMLRLDQPIT